MSDLQARFEQAYADAQALPERPDNLTLLKLYAIYKQATEGDNGRDKPPFTDFVARAKWDAWKKLEGTGREEAMQKFIDTAEAVRAA